MKLMNRIALSCLLLVAMCVSASADNYTSWVLISISARHTLTSGVSPIEDPTGLVYEKALTTGSSTGYVDQSYHHLATVASTASDVYDLNGSLTDAFGTVATFSAVKAITVRNDSLTASIAVGGGATDVAGIGRVVIPADGCLVVSGPLDGWPVASGSDCITVAIATGSTAQYRLIITGNK